MRSLWSRAGQAHRCGCRSCSTVARAGGRRVTAPRRKPTFAEIFTAAYSSVFASAAIIDAIRKDERRRDLDKQLDDTRRDLAELRRQNAQLDPTHQTLENGATYLNDEQQDDLWRHLKNLCSDRPYSEEVGEPVTLRPDALRRWLRQEQYGILSKGEANKLRQCDDRLEKAQLLEEMDESIPRREPTQQTHLESHMNQIYFMVKILMSNAEAKDATRTKRALPSPSFDDAKELIQAGYPNYTYSHVDPVVSRKNIQKLNRANRAAVHDRTIGEKEKIGRICYNLLVSRHPPDMQSLNSMMLAFGKHSQYRKAYAEPIVNTFWYHSRLAPSPTTFATILRFYREANDPGMFLRTIARMTGMDATVGAKIRRRPVADLEWPVVLEWAADMQKRTRTKHYIYEHAPLNMLSVEEIIDGLLGFHMQGQAVDFFLSCLRAGLDMPVRTVKLVLENCVSSLDWNASARLIHNFCTTRSDWPSLMRLCDDNTLSFVINRIYSLLEMTGLWAGEEVSARRLQTMGISAVELLGFVDELSEASRALPDALAVSPKRYSVNLDAENKASRSRYLQISSLSKEVDRVQKTLECIETRFPAAFRHTCQQALQAGRELQTECEEMLKDFAPDAHLERASLNYMDWLASDIDKLHHNTTDGRSNLSKPASSSGLKYCRHLQTKWLKALSTLPVSVQIQQIDEELLKVQETVDSIAWKVPSNMDTLMAMRLSQMAISDAKNLGNEFQVTLKNQQWRRSNKKVVSAPKSSKKKALAAHKASVSQIYPQEEQARLKPTDTLQPATETKTSRTVAPEERQRSKTVEAGNKSMYSHIHDPVQYWGAFSQRRAFI